MRVALAVQETGSFSAAAKRFGRAQSAVSYAVGTLEAQLGIALFDRSGHRALPTHQAGMLLREMAAIVTRCDGLRSKAEALSRGTEPLVRLVIDQLFDMAAVAAALAEFRPLFPSTRIELASECMDAVVARVERGADLGILASLATVPPHIASASIAPIRLLPVAATGAQLTRVHDSFESLRAEEVQIVLSARGVATESPDYLVFAHRTWRVEEIATKLALLRQGAGWGYMPEHLVRLDLQSGSLARLDLPGLPGEDHQPVFVVWHQSRSLGPAAAWLKERLVGQGT